MNNLLKMKVILKDDDKSAQAGGDALNHLHCTSRPLLPPTTGDPLPSGGLTEASLWTMCHHMEGDLNSQPNCPIFQISM